MANAANLYGNAQPSGRTALKDREKDREDGTPKADPLVARYLREIERYNRATSDWYEEGDQITQVYMDEASTGSSRTRRFALLWANTETLKPAVYTKTPVVQCTRRYKDRDPTARTAADIVERATNTTLELYGVDEVFRMVRDDRLLSGRGTAWVRYDAHIEQYEEEIEVIDPETGEVSIEIETHERLKSEKACVDYVHWQDFGHNVARIWSDVWLVWRSVYKTQEDVAERFGGKVAAQLSYNAKVPVGGMDGTLAEEGECFIKIYEIWDKRRDQVSWVADGHRGFLETGAPPISFSNFFPCPEPCYATKTSKSLVPKPDYCYYRDQAKEINDLTDKIGRLTEWLIVKGFIPGGPSSIADPLEEVLRDKGNKELFAQVDSMTEWKEKGGAGGLIDWFPVQHVVQTLQAAIQARAQLIQDVFQITGIADILRGQSDPGETYGAVELRAQTGSRRLRNTKDDLARFCRDIGRLVGEVIAENFSPQSLAEITGYRYQPSVDPLAALRVQVQPNMANVAMFPGSWSPPNAQMMPPGMQMMPPNAQMMPGMGHNGGLEMGDDEPGLTFDDRVVELLRNDRLRGFRIDIETDSTVQADENAERRARTEFVEAAGVYLERAVKTVQMAPALAKTAGELLMFAARAHRAGRAMEETLERDFSNLVKQLDAARRAPKPEDPVITVAKTQVAGEIEKNRLQAQLKSQEVQTDAALEVRKQDLTAALEVRDQNMDLAMKTGVPVPVGPDAAAANDLLSTLANAIARGISQPRRVEIERDPVTGRALAAVSKMTG